MRNRRWGIAIGMTAMLALLAGCEFDNATMGPTKEQDVSLDLNKAQRAHIELDMGAGEMNVRGGTPKLLRGNFEYNVPQWEPVVTDSNDGDVANVVIKQPHSGHMGGHVRYKWDLDLNDEVPLDLRLNCGAGQAKLDLGNLNLRSVNVQMGAGQVDLNLDGHPTHDYSVDVDGGVGQATVRLPQNVGVRAEAHGGLGSIHVEGLVKHDSYYSNSLYGNAKVNVTLKVNGGIGEIRILD